MMAEEIILLCGLLEDCRENNLMAVSQSPQATSSLLESIGGHGAWRVVKGGQFLDTLIDPLLPTELLVGAIIDDCVTENAWTVTSIHRDAETLVCHSGETSRTFQFATVRKLQAEVDPIQHALVVDPSLRRRLGPTLGRVLQTEPRWRDLFVLTARLVCAIDRTLRRARTDLCRLDTRLALAAHTLSDVPELPVTSIPVRSLSVNSEDAALALLWAGRAATPRWKYVMWSARLAELGVRRLLADAGMRTQDLSILQVRDPDAERWKLADVEESGGRLFDVKNSVKASRWLAHAVRKLKAADLGRDVIYVGTWIPHWLAKAEMAVLALALEHIAKGNGGAPFPPEQVAAELYREARIIVLGTATRSSVAALADFAQRRTPHVDLQDIDVAAPMPSVPPFAWEFPEVLVAPGLLVKRRNALEAVRRLGTAQSPVVQLAAGLCDGRSWSSAQTGALYQDLMRILDGEPLTLGRLYLGVLEHFVQCYVPGTGLRSGDGIPLAPSAYADLFGSGEFAEHGRAQGVTGHVHDPSGSLGMLLEALKTILEARGHLPPIRRIAVTASGTVRCLAVDGMRLTLVAHCRTCLAHPLVFGQAPTCVACGGLVCSLRHCLCADGSTLPQERTAAVEAPF
ncbi:hypothetical protein [Azospirillum formosense]|uniref:hypothetical protein n=1 Tax=Azospirillum formosense TaxID=861533 RepID=UPI00338DE2AF